MANTYTVRNATCIRETDQAILVEAPEFDKDEWVPKSQLHDDSEVYSLDDEGDLIVTEWIAKQKGWL